MKASIFSLSLVLAATTLAGCGAAQLNAPCDKTSAIMARNGARRQAQDGDPAAAARLFLEAARTQEANSCFVEGPCGDFGDAVAQGFLAGDQATVIRAYTGWSACIENRGPAYAPSDVDRIMLNVGARISGKRSPFALPASAPVELRTALRQ